jgi:glycosyltransferase involved in cell wall biosynthesis
MQAAYSALDFTVLPTTLPEGLGGVVAESMAMGKPAIASRFGGAVELIEDGVTGLLVEPGDPSDLAEAMAKLLSDTRLRSEMGMRAREAYMQRFEFEPFYQKVTQLYSELVP